MSKLGLVVGLLEDDPDMAALVSHWLEESGYTVRWFRSATEYRRRQGSEAIDLLLLDWMLPDSTGIEVIGAIRSSANSRLPVIFLTARDAEDDMVRGLASGGDDYVVKPPKQRELIARVHAVLRRHVNDSDNGETIDLAPYSVDPRRRRVSIDRRDIDLTQREFDLACFLFRRHGRIISRDALLENVWNLSAAVSTRTVDTHVSRLRKKLDLNGEHGWRLAAIYQHGYRLEKV
ncbi:response regulator transcription factor [Dokdonella soli]|uniref:Response regulator transcription factor n=1 Tax=Dokdonella soli TaxID=529810 RepID=A0ABP3TMP0_9GAMM